MAILRKIENYAGMDWWMVITLFAIILGLGGYYLTLNDDNYKSITGFINGGLNSKIKDAHKAIDAMKYPEAYKMYMKILELNPPENAMISVHDLYYKLIIFNHINQMQTAVTNGGIQTLQTHIPIVKDLLSRIKDKNGQLCTIGMKYLQDHPTQTPQNDSMGKLREIGEKMGKST